MTEEFSAASVTGLVEDPNLPADTRDQLFALTVDRLGTGATLITDAPFQGAMEEGFQALTGGPATPEVKGSIGKLIQEVNTKNPELLRIPGLENFITKGFLGLARKMKWGVLEVNERGNGAIRDFMRQDTLKNLLTQFEITPNQINIRRCFNRVNNVVAGKEDPQQKRAAVRLAQVKAAAQERANRVRAGQKGAPTRRVYSLEALSEPDAQEVEARESSENQKQDELRKIQMANLLENLMAYVHQGKISAEDAQRLAKLHKVDAAVQSGKVTEEKASKVRNSIMEGHPRDALDKKVKEAVDYVVLYTQFFAGLQRIDPKYDDGLRFLVEYKDLINDDKADREAFSPAVKALIEDIDCLHHLIEVMDRQDAEVRMIAAGLPPYSNVMRRGQDRIDAMVVEKQFVDDLRNLTEDDLAERLNDPDKKVQLHTAASMMCMNSLINRMIKATPFRKEMRILKINLIVEEFFRGTDDVEEARRQAEDFLKNRLKSLYPDLSLEESADINNLGAEIIQAAEEKVTAEKAEAKKAKETTTTGDVGDAKPGELSDDELKKGIMIGRVSRRVAGGQRIFRQKVMPDPDEEGKFVLVQKDPDSGEMIPVIRRGHKAHVSHIAMNWRGKALTSLAAIVSLIGSTTTTTGLRIRSEIDKRPYPQGVSVSDAKMDQVHLELHEFHDDWNYTIHPAQAPRV